MKLLDRKAPFPLLHARIDLARFATVFRVFHWVTVRGTGPFLVPTQVLHKKSNHYYGLPKLPCLYPVPVTASTPTPSGTTQQHNCKGTQTLLFIFHLASHSNIPVSTWQEARIISLTRAQVLKQSVSYMCVLLFLCTLFHSNHRLLSCSCRYIPSSAKFLHGLRTDYAEHSKSPT